MQQDSLAGVLAFIELKPFSGSIYFTSYLKAKQIFYWRLLT
jgi:hypothetical protein